MLRRGTPHRGMSAHSAGFYVQVFRPGGCMLSRPRACWSAGVAGASVRPTLAARAVAWTVQRPGRRLKRGSSSGSPLRTGWR
jgi:hypothetical protein